MMFWMKWLVGPAASLWMLSVLGVMLCWGARAGTPALDWIEYYGDDAHSVAVRFNGKDVECASSNGYDDCQWDTPLLEVERQPSPKVFNCGAMQKKVYGLDGYSQPGHWCARAYAQNYAQWRSAASVDEPLLFSVNPNGDVQCLSTNGKECIWFTTTLAPEVLASANPLACGEMHKRLHSTDGYSQPGHWCQVIRARQAELLQQPVVPVSGIAVKMDPTLTSTPGGMGDYRVWVDADGDGVPDLCVVYQSAGRVACYANRKGGLAQLYSKSVSVIGNPSSWTFVPVRTDALGKGIAAFCRELMTTPSSVHLQCDTFQRANDGTLTNSYNITSGWLPAGSLVSGKKFWWVDLAGDGGAAYCRLVDNDLQCTPIRNGAFAESQADLIDLGLVSATSDFTRGWVDADGDGLPDFCEVPGSMLYFAGPVGPSCRLLRKTATGFMFSQTEWQSAVSADGRLIDPMTDYSAAAGLWWQDINGDGKADLCWVSESSKKLRCRLSGLNGASGFPSAGTIVSSSIDLGSRGSRGWADIDGDGMPDFCRLTQKDTLTLMTCLTSQKGLLMGPEFSRPLLASNAGQGTVADGERAWLTPGRQLVDDMEQRYPMYCRWTGTTTVQCMLMRAWATGDAVPAYPSPSCTSDVDRALQSQVWRCPDQYMWHVKAIGLNRNRYTGNSAVTVAVVDQGVAFVGGLAGTEAYSASYTTDSSTNPTMAFGEEAFRHGTAVASIIAGSDFGLATGVKIANVRIGPDTKPGRGCIALLESVGQGVSVINVSGTLPETAVGCADWNLVIRGISYSNVLVVAALGNGGLALSPGQVGPYWPAIYQPPSIQAQATDPVIRVAALKQYIPGSKVLSLEPTSNYGNAVADIAAPGERIPTADLLPPPPGRPNPGTLRLVGQTSAAAPIVSAVLALMKSCAPKATAQQMKSALLDNADQVNSLRDKVKKGRVLNAKRALEAICPKNPG